MKQFIVDIKWCVRPNPQLWVLTAAMAVLAVLLGVSVIQAAVPGDTWITNAAVLTANNDSIDAVTLDDKIFYFGGAGVQTTYSSSDGINWSEVGTNTFPINALQLYKAVVIDNGGTDTIVVTGGIAVAAENEAYSSVDGENWTTNTNTMIEVLYQHCSVVFDDKVWTISGRDASAGVTSVTSTADIGASFVDVGELPAIRLNAGCVTFADKMWLFGGTNFAGVSQDDIYSSSDGITWTNEGNLPTTFHGMGSLVYDEKVYLFGGRDSVASSYVSKVWTSLDGISFTEVGTDSMPVAMQLFGETLFQGQIWLIAGSPGAPTDDVYNSSAIIGETAVAQPSSVLPNVARDVSDVTSQTGDPTDAGLPLGWIAQIAADGTGYPIRFFWLIVAAATVIGTGLAFLKLAKGNIFIPAIATTTVSLFWFAFGQGIIPFEGVFVIGAVTLLTSLIIRESVAA